MRLRFTLAQPVPPWAVEKSALTGRFPGFALVVFSAARSVCPRLLGCSVQHARRSTPHGIQQCSQGLYTEGVVSHSPGLAAGDLPEAAYPGGKPLVRFYPEGVAPPDRALTDGIEDEHE